MPDTPLPPVFIVGAGPGGAEHLTLGALRAIEAAEVVVHDRLVGPEVLALIPEAARRIDVGKEGFGPSTPQDRIAAILVAEARRGLRVVRLKGGDPGIFARLDEELSALEAAGLDWRILPGLTAASVAAAAIGQGLTQRGRNTGLRLLTGQAADGLAEHDWRGLARPGEVAAIYMGRRSARFIQGRLMMHGADPATPVTVVANAGRAGETAVAATLATMPAAAAQVEGPAVLLYGLAPRRAATAGARRREGFA
jgi:uroporphyrin-III C-methyltransferase